MAKIMPKMPMSAFFAIFWPLRGIRTLHKYFYLVEEVLSFNLVVICKIQLSIGFRDEFLTFTGQNEVDLDDLHILKIGFKNGLRIGSGNFPQHLLQDFLQNFL